MQELMQTNPMESMQLASAGANHSVVTVESKRAIAEALGKIQIAKSFPRSEQRAIAMLKEACRTPEFAATAFYSVPNRGSGPSIRFAEEVARVYGNFTYGHKELERSAGRSVVEVYAWDVENNNYSTRQLTVEHVVDTRNGPKKLTDQADIDNRIANVASKQMRGRILALLPKALVACGIAECKKTMAGDNTEPIGVRIQRMAEAFSKFSVTTKHLEAYIGHTLDNVTADEFADLLGVFNAIKEGAKPSEYFDLSSAGHTTDACAQLNASLAAPKEPAAATPAPKPQPQRQPRTTAQAKPVQQSTAAAAPAPEPEHEVPHVNDDDGAGRPPEGEPLF